jgi:ATP-dependent Clp protease protease subunit
MAKPWYKFAVNKATGGIDINIFDEIGAWGYSFNDFNKELQNAGSGKITLRLNTPGGSVWDGFAIYNVLSRIRDRVTVVIEGVAASMGSVIAMAGKKVIMPENALMMIHDPAGMVAGGPEELASFADMLSQMRDSIAKAYSDRTGIKIDEIRQMMAKETWLSAKDAVKMGFADEVEKPIQMAAHAGFDLKCYLNVPRSFGTSTLTHGENMDQEIKRICALFGKADMAQGFIDAKKTVADVLTALETAKAADDKAVKDAADAAAAAARAAEGKPPTAEEIRSSVLAEISEINSLCALAGMADKAAGFIEAKKSVKDVIAALSKLKQDAAEAAAKTGKGKKVANTEVSAHHTPNPHAEGGHALALDTGKIWDRHNGVGKRK